MSGILAPLFNNFFSVNRRLRTSDGAGGFLVSYSLLGYVDGRIRPASTSERQVARSEERLISHVLYTAAAEDIERGDRVDCGPLSVEVMGIREPSLAGHHLEIDAWEIQQEDHA